MCRLLHFVLYFAIFTSWTGAASAEKLPFIEAYELAQEAAPNVLIAQYRVDGAEAQKDVALGNILPQVSLFGQYSKNEVRYDDAIFFQDQNYPGERYGLQVRQPILNVANGLEVLRLDLLHDLSREELRIAETELLTRLVEAFLNVLLSDAAVEQVNTELKALDSQLLEAQALYARNLVAVTQVLETQARRDAISAEAITARGGAAVAREELLKLTGKRGVEPSAVQENIVLLSRFHSAEEAAAEAVKTSPGVLAAETAVKAARRAIDRERSRWIPTVDITYNLQHSDVGFDNLSSPPRDTSTIAIGFNYPIFEGGAGNARIRGAWSEFNAANTQLQAEVRNSEARARSAWLNLEAVGERLVAARQASRSAETNVAATRKGVQAGTNRVTDVLVALAQKTRADREESMAKFQYAMAWVELEMASGADPDAIAPVLSAALHGS